MGIYITGKRVWWIFYWNKPFGHRGEHELRWKSIKEEDHPNLRTRVNELLKCEDCKLVNFGVFSATLDAGDVIRTFVAAAKARLKSTCHASVLGRIWSLEVNGTGKGCGLIAADDKIHVWKDL